MTDVDGLKNQWNDDDEFHEIYQDKEHLLPTSPNGSSNESAKITTRMSNLWNSRLSKTICLILLWICLGMATSITSTALVDFSERLHENYGKIGIGMSANQMGVLFGLALGGCLSDWFRFAKEQIIGGATMLLALATFAKPFSGTVAVFIGVSAFEGAAKGIVKPVANAMMLSMWKEKAPTPVHIFHFGYGLGAFIGPLLTKSYLSLRCPPIIYSGENETAINEFAEICKESFSTDEITFIRESQIEIPFAVIAILMFSVGLLFLMFHVQDARQRKSRKMLSQADDNTNSRLRRDYEANRTSYTGAIITGLLVCFYFTLAGGDGVIGNFLFTISFESDLHCSKKDAASMTSVFFGAFTTGRLLSAFVLHWISVKFVFIVYMFAAFGAMGGLAFLGLLSKQYLWIFSGLVGLFCGPLWPSGLSWSDRYVKLSASAIAIIEVGASVGGIVAAWMAGHLIENSQIASILLFSFICVGVGCFIVVTLYIIVFRLGDRHDREKYFTQSRLS